jgi:hypothetical protein
MIDCDALSILKSRMRSFATGLLRGIALAMALSLAGPGQAADEWRTTQQQISGNAQQCGSGGRGTLRIVNNVMMFYPQGLSFLRWKIALAADGSADKIVHYEDYPARKLRIIVPAGVGPREISTVPQETVCRYRFIPD